MSRWIRVIADDRSGQWWSRYTIIGEFSIENAPWLGGWILSHQPLEDCEGRQLGGPMESKKEAKRRFRGHLRKLARGLRAELGE
jgi:hypothetical protein